MADIAPQSTPAFEFEFIRDGAGVEQNLDWHSGPDVVRKAVGEALNARNVAFLLGAGCSSLVREAKQHGIATMQPLAKEFCEANAKTQASSGITGEQDAGGGVADAWALDDAEKRLLADMGVSLTDPEYERNLERLMEALHSLHFVLNHVRRQKLWRRRASGLAESSARHRVDVMWRCGHAASADVGWFCV